MQSDDSEAVFWPLCHSPKNRNHGRLLICFALQTFACGRLGYEAQLGPSEAGVSGADGAFMPGAGDAFVPAADAARDAPFGGDGDDGGEDANAAGDGVSAAPIDLTDRLAEGWKVVFVSGFDAPSSQFPSTPVTVCGGFGSILGGAGILGLKDTLTLSLDLPPHTEIHVMFDAVVIDSWDREFIYMNFGKQRVVEIPCGKLGSSFCNRKSYQCGSSNLEDDVDGQVRLEATSPHYDSSIDIVIGAILDQPRLDESWGLNNLAVLVR